MNGEVNAHRERENHVDQGESAYYIRDYRLTHLDEGGISLEAAFGFNRAFQVL